MKRIKALLINLLMISLSCEVFAGTDYAITDFQVPAQIIIGTTGTVKITIKNIGDVAPITERWEVNLYDENDNSIAMYRPMRGGEDEYLQPDQEINIELEIIPDLLSKAKQTYYAKVAINEDISNENNISERKEIEILRPPFPKVTNLEGEKTEDNITLSWIAPIYGDTITFAHYNLYRNGILLNESSTLTEVNTTSYTDTNIEPLEYNYQITAVYTKGEEVYESDFSNEVSINCSNDRSIYYQTFRSLDDFNSMTIINTNNDARIWQYNEDMQYVYYQFAMANGADDWLITPAIKLKSNTLYTLIFKAGNRNRDTERIKVMMGTAPTVEGMNTVLIAPTELTTGNFQTLKASISVPSDGEYYIGFYACSDAGKFQLLLDQILVEQNIDYDLVATDINSQLEVKAGGKTDVDIYLKNMGAKVASDYTVELYNDKNMLESKVGPEINPGQEINVTFEINQKLENSGIFYYHAIINYDKDLNINNNNSDTIAINVTIPKYPIITDLNGIEDNSNVKLNWSIPDYSDGFPITKSETEGFENYTAFSISNIGNWIMADLDQGETGSVSNVTYENATIPKAFMVFNPTMAGLSDDEEMWKPYSGNQMLVCFDGAIANDDWLISPEIETGGQIITFYAKTADIKMGSEAFDIQISSSDNSTSSFKKIDEVTAVPGEWTLYTFIIPDNAKYFAIHCISADCSALLIDDLTYSYKNGTEHLTLKGYNVYRDGEKLTEVPITSNTYIDSDVAVGEHTYKVTTIYDKGESLYSNEITVNVVPNAIEFTLADSVFIAAGEGQIRIIGEANNSINIYTIDGKLIYEALKTETNTICVTNGCYIVKIGGKSIKIIVR